jgi:type IV secretion system T-DNA border endonuclease VirD1
LSKATTKKRRGSVTKQEPWKGKVPNQGSNRGRWKPPTEENISAKIGFAVVSVKLRPAEKEEFQVLCKELGVSPNWAMRSMTRQACGFLEVHKEALSELKTITRQISGVATNINQIAKAGNRTKDPDYLGFMEDRKQLGKELARLEQMMQRILSVGHRRSDGLARLTGVVDAS